MSIVTRKKCKLKPQDITIHLLEWLFKTKTKPERTRMWRSWTSHTPLVDMKTTLEKLWLSLKSINQCLSRDPAILPLLIYPREMKSHVHTKTRTGMFTAALFVIVKNPGRGQISIRRWVRSLRFSHTRNELLTHTVTWMNPQISMLNERSHIHAYMRCDFIYIKFSKAEQLLLRVGEWRKTGRIAKGPEVTSWCAEHIHYLG